MSTPRDSRVLLVILDGFGIAPAGPGNAITSAITPHLDELMMKEWMLDASGSAVGLPGGQQGNSEVGHMTIGSGRVVFQPLPRISGAIASGEFFSNPVLATAMEKARARGGAVHVVGLISPGGVHSHQEHAVALIRMADEMGIAKIVVHAILDGRDVAPKSGADLLDAFIRQIPPSAQVATVAGRFYAMDRDQRWDRVAKFASSWLGRAGVQVDDPVSYVRAQYEEGIFDEFVVPAVVGARTDGAMASEDLCIFFNFRPDRMREIVHLLTDGGVAAVAMEGVKPHEIVTFTEYEEGLQVKVAFPAERVDDTVADVVSRAGLAQFHVAETEKYAHVTYFFNGGREAVLPLEERLLIPSQRVTTYDLAPEMSASAITDAILGRMDNADLRFIVANYANPDMVGHTGNLEATVKAVEVVDHEIGRLRSAANGHGWDLIITADHGNAEVMVDRITGERITSHTTGRVPFMAEGPHVPETREEVPVGGLSDIGPTVLGLLDIAVPSAMTGKSLLCRPRSPAALTNPSD